MNGSREATIAATTPKGELGPVARHIARSAAKLFAERGYDATSVREIVEAAGVAKPTLYYYFGSKEGLAQSLLTIPLSGLVATLRHLVAAEADPIRCMEGVLDAQYTFCRDDPDRARFIYALLFGPLRSEVAGELQALKAGLVGWIEAAVRRLAEAGIIPRERVDACCSSFRGLVVISTMDFLFEDKALGQDLAKRQVHETLNGFGCVHFADGRQRHK
jgi:TetR/AcrR family transcriptional regulator